MRRPAFEKKIVHKPVQNGECFSCHNAHGSDEAKLLKATGAKLCAQCHGDLMKAGRGQYRPSALRERTVPGVPQPSRKQQRRDDPPEPEHPLSRSAMRKWRRRFKASKSRHKPVEDGLVHEVPQSPSDETRQTAAGAGARYVPGLSQGPEGADEQGDHASSRSGRLPGLPQASWVAAGKAARPARSGDLQLSATMSRRIRSRSAHIYIDASVMNCRSCHDPHASKDPKFFKENVHAPFAGRSCDDCHIVNKR